MLHPLSGVLLGLFHPFCCSSPVELLTTILWIRDGVVIKAKNTTDDLKLLLSAVTVNDTGSYECTVKLTQLVDGAMLAMLTLDPVQAGYLQVLGIYI